MRGKPGPSQDAARLVLVDGMGPMDAARETGASPSAVSNAVKRVRDAMEIAHAAVDTRDRTSTI